MIQSHSSMNSTMNGKKELIFDRVALIPGTMMTVYHCPISGCWKRNYIDAKSVRTHCKKVHHFECHEPIPEKAPAQFICQVRGCQKLFMETIQIEAHMKHHRTYVPTNGSFTCFIMFRCIHTSRFAKFPHLGSSYGCGQ